jgi:nicotinamide-nucleotide amidase
MSSASALAEEVLALARSHGFMIVTAESCTGGMVAAALTDVAGSSDVFDRGFVTYSNAAKMELLAVRPPTLERHGAVSGETAAEMAQGALANSQADLAISITGIAGPGGGSAEKPVGLVWFAVARRNGPTMTMERRFGDAGRSAVRADACVQALELLLQVLNPSRA